MSDAMVPVDKDTQNWVFGAHLGATATLFFLFGLGFIGPLAVMLMKQDNPMVQWHAKQSIAFQFALLVANFILQTIGGMFCVFLIITLPVGLVLFIAQAAMPLWIAYRVNNGEMDAAYPGMAGLVGPAPV